MATISAVGNMPALGLLSEEGKLEHTTEPFRRWYAGKEDLLGAAPELKRVLEGQANAAVLRLDDLSLDIAAMVDKTGERHVLLTLPTEELPSLGDAGGALLDGALDESPALVWLKDLDGRYIRANPRFTSLLGTSEDRLLGRTDAELPPTETVDGPRLQERGDDEVEEPLQLEYFVGAFQGRDALVALRFPVVDHHGVPTLVCGVAAPTAEADLARSEAARLLRIERWSRLDAESVRAELLAEWGVLPDARGRTVTSAPTADHATNDREQQAAVAEARAERATAIAERDSALGANEQLTHEVEAARARLAELERALHDARQDGGPSDAEAMLAAQAAELERGLTRERERAEELERSLTMVRQRLGDDAESARVEVQRSRADAEAARTEVERARADADAARADLEKARADADALRAAATGEREAAANATATLEREVKQARDQLAALERQQGANDWDPPAHELRAADKARLAAEAALADAVGERDGALKSRAALAGELEQERKQVAALRDTTAGAEERIRELTGGLERERVRAAGFEQAQARVNDLEGEIRGAITRADKTEGELQIAVGRVERAERDMQAAGARAEKADGELRTATMRADKAEIELDTWRGRVEHFESELARARKRIEELEGKLESGQTRMVEVQGEAEAGRARVLALQGEIEVDRARIGQLQEERTAGQTRIGELGAEVKAGQGRIGELEALLLESRGKGDRADIAIGELEARTDEAEARAEQAEGRAGQAETRAEQSDMRAEEAETRAEQAEARAEQAEARAGQAETRAEQAETRADEAEGRAQEAEAQAAAASVQRPEPDEVEPTSVEAEVEPAFAAGPAVASEEPAVVLPAAPLAKLESANQAVPAHAGSRVSWQPTAKRTLSASLARESVWRNVLKETVQVLGAEGGWDTVTAWLPDESNQLGCAATWTAHRGLDQFETLTAEATVRREGSLLDQALQAPHLTWLTDIDAVDDERLQTAAAHGMSSALLLPVRSGTSTIGLLELLTHDAIEPDAQIALSLEAAVLQLGRFGHLLSLGGKPA
jgi:PAS domain-containing protein/predicted  nucleic acid-binding Zn-ribbon protein